MIYDTLISLHNYCALFFIAARFSENDPIPAIKSPSQQSYKHSFIFIIGGNAIFKLKICFATIFVNFEINFTLILQQSEVAEMVR